MYVEPWWPTRSDSMCVCMCVHVCLSLSVYVYVFVGTCTYIRAWSYDVCNACPHPCMYTRRNSHNSCRYVCIYVYAYARVRYMHVFRCVCVCPSARLVRSWTLSTNSLANSSIHNPTLLNIGHLTQGRGSFNCSLLCARSSTAMGKAGVVKCFSRDEWMGVCMHARIYVLKRMEIL